MILCKNENCIKKERDYGLDLLKAIGLLLIILAHTNIPDVISQFRSFDVPLMVIISAILAQKTYKKGNTKEYVKKRYLRLVVPTHIFLVAYFAIMYFFSRDTINLKLIVNSFLLLHKSIGFVWIILVYFMCALLVPLISRIDFNKIGTKILMIVAYILYEILVYFRVGFSSNLLYSIFYFIIPYGIITLLGFNYDKLMKKDKLCICGTCLISNCLILISNLVFRHKYILYTQYKYPPTLYFLSYGILISIILIEIVRKNKIKKNKYISFIAENSLYIYLIHILVLKFVEVFSKNINWIIQYLIVFVLSLMLVYVKNIILNILEQKTKIKFNILKG